MLSVLTILSDRFENASYFCKLLENHSTNVLFYFKKTACIIAIDLNFTMSNFFLKKET